MNKKTNIIRHAWDFLNSILLILVIVFAIALLGVRFFHLDLYVVLSGSMEPTYKTGSVIYVKNVAEDNIQQGDIITYYMDETTIVTHRVVEITEENGTTLYYTKGDANDMADAAPVTADNIIGKPIFSIPYLGYLVAYIQTKSGKYATVAVGLILLLLNILPDMIFGKKEEDA